MTCPFKLRQKVLKIREREDLPNLPPGALLVMDNAAFHKRFDTQHGISAAGYILEYLPRYSPDLDPIEHKWAQAKAIRRKTGKATQEIFKRKF